MYKKICCLFSVAASVHAELSPSSAGASNESTEKKVVTQLSSLGPPGAASEEDEDLAGKEEAIANLKKQVNAELKKLGVKRHQFTLVPKKSIKSYFVCESEEQLHQLRIHYESGLLKDMLERIFSLLAGEQVNIGLRWTAEEYRICQQQFSALMSK